MPHNNPPQQPATFPDFQFSFDPNVHHMFPEPPPVPPSAELFSTTETTNLFGFLDNFNWEFDADALGSAGLPQVVSADAYMHADHGVEQLQPPQTDSISSMGDEIVSTMRPHPYARHQHQSASPADTSISQSSYSAQQRSQQSSANSRANRPLLTDPQKRMNHIMSEQKRRNAIREGYAQLTTLLAPAGAPPGTGMPTRGRPKGSGSKGKNRPGAGKSGVLLRAVEYIRWLEEGRDALIREISRLEPLTRMA